MGAARWTARAARKRGAAAGLAGSLTSPREPAAVDDQRGAWMNEASSEARNA